MRSSARRFAVLLASLSLLAFGLGAADAHAAERVQDGGLEGFSCNASACTSSIWTETDTAGNSASPFCANGLMGACNPFTARTGTKYLLFYGAGMENLTVSQSGIQIPAAPATLSFWMSTGSITGPATITVLIDGQQVFTRGASPYIPYTLFTVDVGARAGPGPHTLSFRRTAPGGATNDYFLVDDISLDAASGPPLVLATQATASVTIGQQISDTATLTAGASPTGTLTFRAWLNPSCTGPPDYTSNPVTVNGTGTYNSSPAFVPAAVGTYHWIASYSGDGNNPAVSGSCNDPGETSVVNNPTPALTTLATASATLGQPISDAATISGGSSPGGTVSFKAWLDPFCAGPPEYNSNPVAVAGAGTYNSSPAFIPAAIGTYHWIATYSGDANNNPIAGACNDPGEASIVTSIPSNEFSLGKLAGTKLNVNVATAGRVDVTDANARKRARKPLLKPSNATGGPGKIVVPLKLTGPAKKVLKRKHKLKVHAKITFTPTGGVASTQTKTLKLKAK